MSKLIYPQKNMHFQSKTLAIVALIIGIFALFQQAHPEAEIMFLISILFGSYQHTVELNPDENSIRSSRRIFFLNFGKWHNLDLYTDTFILRKTLRTGARYNLGQETILKATVFQLFMAQKNHRKKVLIQSFENNEHAQEAQEQMAKKMKLKVVKFNPPISQRTRERN